MSIPNENASWCKFCGDYSNSGFEICNDCFKEKLKQERKKTIEEIKKLDSLDSTNFIRIRRKELEKLKDGKE